VEESFNIQAIHDILEYGVDIEGLENYDHFEFPGVVPRTFIGSLILSGISWPIIHIMKILIPTWIKFYSQYVVRIVFGLFNVYTLSCLRTSIKKSFGQRVAILFGVISGCQFHTIFWASRTLPNMFAYPLAVIFRFEVLMLLSLILILELSLRNLNFYELLDQLTIAIPIYLALTLIIDSYFWQTFMWPEFFAFHFNVILGKSVDWGVSPFHIYFTSFLPRLLLLSLPLSILSIFVDQRTHEFFLPMIIFVFLFSFLGHKEWRFIVYVVPIFNMCSALGIVWIYNYPGGVALQNLHIIENDFLDAMTGVSRFGELRNDWHYSKDESHSSPEDYKSYTHLLTSKPKFHEGSFTIIDMVDGYQFLRIKKTNEFTLMWIDLFNLLVSYNKNNYYQFKEMFELVFPIEIVLKPKIWIMKRKDDDDKSKKIFNSLNETDIKIELDKNIIYL
ncbi:3720_t:CDS:2, partial [Entrophospora sp. SA101]